MGFLDTLKSFNRKERFILLHHVLGFEAQTFPLSDSFRRELAACVGIPHIPRGTYVAMDYHLDWLHLAVHIASEAGVEWPVANAGLMRGNQQDIDLLVAFEERGEIHLVLVEAKGDTYWSNDQLYSKVARLDGIFPTAGIAVPHFVLMSPVESHRIQCDDWPGWMKREDGRPYWLELPLPDGLLKPVRCDQSGKADRQGGSVTLVNALRNGATSGKSGGGA